MVMNNLLRDPKVAHNVVQKESCSSSTRELSLPSSTGHQANKFGQLVTQTNMALQPLSKGRPITKSTVQYKNRSGGIGRGAKAPGGS